jgi:hypothetical protein
MLNTKKMKMLNTFDDGLLIAFEYSTSFPGYLLLGSEIPNLVPRVFNKDPGMVWSRASPKFSAQGGVGKVSNYMLPMGYYKKINFANY